MATSISSVVSSDLSLFTICCINNRHVSVPELMRSCAANRRAAFPSFYSIVSKFISSGLMRVLKVAISADTVGGGHFENFMLLSSCSRCSYLC